MNKRLKGTEYEKLAEAYLKKQGHIILKRNYRNKFGEIDIITQKGPLLIFHEIKYRSSTSCGTPLEAVDFRKQKRITRVAMGYLFEHGYSIDHPGRFDVIGINQNGEMEHIRNAFDLRI